MKKLSQITSLVTANSVEQILNLDDDGGTKLKRLLKGVITGDFKNDKDAALSIYRNSPKSKSYQMLKGRLKERMLDKFFLMDSERAMKSHFDKLFYQSLRNVFAAQIMMLKDMREHATELLRSSLIKTQHHHFTDISLTIARSLQYDAAFRGNEMKWNHYNKLIEQLSELQKAEMIAEKYSQVIVVEFARKNPSDKLIRKKAAASYRKICEVAARFKSRTIELNKFKTGARYYTIIGEHRKSINLCNQCEKYLLDNPHLVQKIRLAEMALFKMDNCLAMRDDKNGLHYALECEKYFNPGQTNWLIFRECHFLLCMHTGNYSKALQLFYEVTEHPKFHHQNPERLEKWKIFEAYLNYALPSQLPKKNFNLFKFLNEMHIYSKDKKGFNFAILIAEIILLIEIGDMDKLINIAEPFRVYVARYVSRKNNLRSYYFSKLLMVLFKYEFNPEKSEQIGKKFYDRLNGINPVYNGDLEGIEVIPYDVLWKLLLNKLKENKRPGVLN
jgi:hypothetical protein